MIRNVDTGLYEFHHHNHKYQIEKIMSPDSNNWWWVLKRCVDGQGIILEDTDTYRQMVEFVKNNLDRLEWMQ